MQGFFIVRVEDLVTKILTKGAQDFFTKNQRHKLVSAVRKDFSRTNSSTPRATQDINP
jgi:hypothetical protein